MKAKTNRYLKIDMHILTLLHINQTFSDTCLNHNLDRYSLPNKHIFIQAQSLKWSGKRSMLTSPTCLGWLVTSPSWWAPCLPSSSSPARSSPRRLPLSSAWAWLPSIGSTPWPLDRTWVQQLRQWSPLWLPRGRTDWGTRYR